jgi:hypothetical protein
MGREERTSFRCQVSEDETAAVLNCLDTPLNTRLVNESSGGFLVTIDSATVVCVGDSALLQTSAGSFTVRVMHTREGTRETHVGLQRTGDLVASDPPLGGRVWWHRTGRSPMLGSSNATALAAMLLVALIAAVLTGSSLLSGNRLVAMLQTGGATTKDGTAEGDRPDSARRGGGTTAAGANSPLTAADDPIRAMTQEAVRRMDRTKGLLSPRTSSAVGLTEPQKNAIQGILDDAGKRLWKQMADNAHETTTRRAQRCLAVLDEMDQRVEQRLTKAQQAAWAAVDASYNGGPRTAAATSTDPPSDAVPSDAVPPTPDPADQSPAA